MLYYVFCLILLQFSSGKKKAEQESKEKKNKEAESKTLSYLLKNKRNYQNLIF